MNKSTQQWVEEIRDMRTRVEAVQHGLDQIVQAIRKGTVDVEPETLARLRDVVKDF